MKSTGKSTIGVITKMTKKAWGLSAIPAVLILWLLWMSISYNSLFSMQDSSRWLFVLPPVLLALIIAAAMARVAMTFLGTKITLSPTHLSVEGKSEKHNVQVAWKSLIYTPPKAGGFLRVLAVASNERTTNIYEIFTPGFEFLCKEVAKRKTFSISSDSMGNMVIDSGKLGHH